MATDVDLIDRLARSVVGIAQDAELDLLGRIARQLVRGIDAPGWAERQMAQVATLRTGWEQVLTVYLRGMRTTGGQAIIDAGTAGEDAALRALRAVIAAPVPGTPPSSALPGQRAVLALADELAGVIGSTKFGVLRSAEDIFRTVIAQTTGRVLLGTQTRRGVAQQVLDRLASSGVGGFVDSAGRRWELASYVEMATRTAAQRAMSTAHDETLQRNGVDLVIVSNAPQECRRCRPWEGKVLSLSGGTRGTVRLASAVDPAKTVEVHVSGSLDEAKRAGLFHPNCRHSTAAYLPGLTRPASSSPADPAGDAARRRLRELERNVRAAKMRQAAAMDEPARLRAGQDIRRWQGEIRAHVASTTAKRQPQRERVGTAR